MKEIAIKKDILDSDGKIKLKLNIALPVIEGDLQKITEKLYTRMANGFASFCEKKFFSHKSQLPAGGVLGYHITYEDEKIVSVITEAYVFDGEERSKKAMTSQVWSKKELRLMNFYDFADKNFRENLPEILYRSSSIYAENDDSEYLRSYKEKLISNLVISHFYILPDGIAFYYDAGVLSPSKNPEIITFSTFLRKVLDK